MSNEQKTTDTDKGHAPLAGVSCWAFNLNHTIYVKIKPEGFKYWHKKHNEQLPGKWHEPLSYFTDKADKDGWVKFQAWEFIQTFGDSIVFGRMPVFETEVRFKRDEMKPCS